MEEQVRVDNERTAYQLYHLLMGKGYSISLRTIFRCRSARGWMFRNSTSCQLIQKMNEVKQLIWAEQYISDSINGVIGTDECTVQIESHRLFACRKCSEAPLPKPRCGTLPKATVSLHKPKHPT